MLEWMNLEVFEILQHVCLYITVVEWVVQMFEEVTMCTKCNADSSYHLWLTRTGWMLSVTVHVYI